MKVLSNTLNTIDLLYYKYEKIILFLITSFLFLLYFLPYLLNGKDTYILIHDNLDSINSLGIFDGKSSISIFPDKNAIAYDMPGVSYQFRHKSISIVTLFYKYLGYFWGYIFNEFLYRFIGLIGFFLLFKRLFKKKDFPYILSLLISFSFITLPFYPRGNLSVVGIPLIILLFYNLYENKNNLLSLFLIVLFTLYSSFMLIGIFLIIILGLVFLYLWISEKRFNTYFFIGVCLLTLSYILTNYELFSIQFLDKIPNNREEVKLSVVGFKESLQKMQGVFLNSQYHAHSFHKTIILPTLIVLIPILLYFKQFEYKKIFFSLLLFVILASVAYGMYYFHTFNYYYRKLHLGVNIARFYFLSPGAWYIMWGIALYNFYKLVKLKKIGFIILFMLISTQILYNIKSYTYDAFTKRPYFSELMSQEQFAEIIKELNIDKTKTRIGCIAFYPSVANYNGLKTIGGYRSFYDLEFKNQFYEIIKDELAQNNHYKNYFLNWGSRVYLFDNEVNFQPPTKKKLDKTKDITCELNIEELKKYNVQYLFSISKIINTEEKGLKEVYLSHDEKYFYRFYIYKIL